MTLKLFIVIISLLAFINPILSQNPLNLNDNNSSSIGIYIAEIKSGEVVYEFDSKRVLTPASITKAYTSATALNLLPHDFKFSTDIKITGEIIDGILMGDLIISANGDPTLESRHFPEYTGICDSIVKYIKQLDICSIDGRCIFEYANQSNDFGANPRWQIDDVAWAYGTGYYPFNFRDNIFKLTAKDMTTKPCVTDLSVIDITTSGEENDIEMLRGFDSYTLYLTGTAKDLSRYEVNCAVPYPEDIFCAELTDSLSKNGISVCGNHIDFPSDTITIYSHYSPPLNDILRSLMIRSDNMFAESILRAFAPNGQRQQALSVQNELWEEKGLHCDYTTIYDGSGLSRGNKFSAEFIGQVLIKMTNESQFGDYLSLFPRVGIDGTVKNFMSRTRLKGLLALKTGSMSGVQCYAGYKLDRNGNATHVVVIMVNNFFCKRAVLRDAISRFLLSQF